MLSIEKCRTLIPDSETYSDEQIEEIRASVYELAGIALDDYMEKKRNNANQRDTSISSL